MFPPHKEKSSHLPHVSEGGDTTLWCLPWHIKYSSSLLFLNSCHNPRPYDVLRTLFQTVKVSALNPNTPIFPSVQQAHKSSICLEDLPHQGVTCSTDSGQDALVRDGVHPKNTSFLPIPETHHFWCPFVLLDAGDSHPDRLCLLSCVLWLAGMSAQTMPCLHSHTGSTPSWINLLSCHSSGPQLHRQRLLLLPVMGQGQSSDAGRRSQGCSCPSCICSWNEPTIPLP